MELCKVNWDECNAHVYSHFLGRLPSWVILKNAGEQIRAITANSRSNKKIRKMENILEEITFVLRPLANLEVPCEMTQNEDDDRGN